jgi:regulator of sirC expression with transglutaminase-like and TPR domain
MDGEEWIAAANEYLFETLGFRGNRENYYAPRNSCLSDVLMERAGIPITLAVVYMEVARRVGRDVQGIGLPGHFVARYRDQEGVAYIDCFNGGRVMSADECRDLASRVAGVDIGNNPRALSPVSKWQIGIRMLNNLRVAYYEAKEFDKAIRVLDMYLAALPASAEEYKQRGSLHLSRRRPVEALRDFQKYIELAPQAPDRAEIEQHAADLRRYVRSLN